MNEYEKNRKKSRIRGKGKKQNESTIDGKNS